MIQTISNKDFARANSELQAVVFSRIQIMLDDVTKLINQIEAQEREPNESEIALIRAAYYEIDVPECDGFADDDLSDKSKKLVSDFRQKHANFIKKYCSLPEAPASIPTPKHRLG